MSLEGVALITMEDCSKGMVCVEIKTRVTTKTIEAAEVAAKEHSRVV